MCFFSLQYIIAAVTSSFVLFLLTVRTLAAWLQIRSYGADVAGIARYLMTSFPIHVSASWCFPPRQRTVVDLWFNIFHFHLEFGSKEQLIKFIITLPLCSITLLIIINDLWGDNIFYYGGRKSFFPQKGSKVYKRGPKPPPSFGKRGLPPILKYQKYWPSFPSVSVW